MANLIARAIDTIRDEGFVPLVQKALVLLKLRWLVFRSAVSGGHEVEIAGSTVTVHLSTIEEAITLRYILANETAYIETVVSGLEPGDVVWDVGANIGVHSCLFGKHAEEVVSIEPYPPNVRRLRKNVEANGVDAEILPIALSNRDGTEQFSAPDSDSPGNQWAGLLPDSVSESRQEKLWNTNVTEVDVRRGDTLIEEGTAAPDVIKIDVEGASHKVIEGLEDWLRNGDCRSVFVEVHLPDRDERRPSVEDFGREPTEVEKRLAEYGFETSVILERDWDFFVKATKDE